VNEGPLTKSDTLVLYSKFKQLVELNKTYAANQSGGRSSSRSRVVVTN